MLLNSLQLKKAFSLSPRLLSIKKLISISNLAAFLEITETSDAARQPLVIFYDCETTGLKIPGDSIVEIGATVVDHKTCALAEGSKWTFSKLVNTSNAIPQEVSMIHGIYARDLKGEDNFKEVYSQFCVWVKEQVNRFSEAAGVTFYPVLAAHNGYQFDFPLLFSEITKHGMDFSFFKDNDFAFFDTYQHLLKLRNEDQYTTLKQQASLSLQKLYKGYFSDKEYKGHRALNDAEYLRELFMETELKSSLSLMKTVSLVEMIQKWEVRCKNSRACV